MTWVGNHEVIPRENPKLITYNTVDTGLLKQYASKPVIKTSAMGYIINHDHGRAAAFGVDTVRNLLLLGVKDRERVVVEDVTRGIAFTSIVRLLKTRAYVRIPKHLWQFYNPRDEIIALITPLHTR